MQARVNELADRTTAHWWSLIAPLIVNAESAVCYDGQYFFDTDHSEGDSGTQSNDITSAAATPANPTAAEMIKAIMASVEKMIGYKDDRGEYVNENLTEFYVVVGTGLMKHALEALTQTRVSGGDSNILIEQDSFRFRVEASPRLSSWTTKFAIFSTQGTQKPIIRQQRKPNNAAPGYSVDGMLMETLWLDSEHCKKHDECLVSVETERAAAYGDWKKPAWSPCPDDSHGTVHRNPAHYTAVWRARADSTAGHGKGTQPGRAERWSIPDRAAGAVQGRRIVWIRW